MDFGMEPDQCCLLWWFTDTLTWMTKFPRVASHRRTCIWMICMPQEYVHSSEIQSHSVFICCRPLCVCIEPLLRECPALSVCISTCSLHYCRHSFPWSAHAHTHYLHIFGYMFVLSNDHLGEQYHGQGGILFKEMRFREKDSQQPETAPFNSSHLSLLTAAWWFGSPGMVLL